MSSEFAIRITDLGKCYHIYEQPIDRLKQGICYLFAKLSPAKILKRYWLQKAESCSRQHWALRELSFSLEKGGCFGIIGRNGSGKSTLLQLLTGTLAPTTGNIEINGRVAALLELGSGFNPEYSGRENIYLNAQLLGLSKEQIDARIDDIIAFADIGDFIEQPVKTYSSGMFVRVAFSVVAHVDADILIIDEALAVGDAFFTQKCMRFLRKFMETGTVLLVSHDSSAVTGLCERALWLSKGRCAEIGSSKEVTENYLQALYSDEQPIVSATPKAELKVEKAVIHEERIDARSEWLNQTSLRNDMQLFEFDPSGRSFGNGEAKIISVELRTSDMLPLSWVVGGERVILDIRVEAVQEVSSPIVGFYIKDRLGQTLFGDNTYLTYANQYQQIQAGERVSARFHFAMPFLPAGDYSICAAIAAGSNDSHVQLEWIHDAMIFKSVSSHVTTGLIGIPMQKIEVVQLS